MRAATRRRFITISAAAAGFSLLAPRAQHAETSFVHVWRGAALGADAMLLLHHPDPAAAGALSGTRLRRWRAWNASSASTTRRPRWRG
jgi:hypothetical protein